MYQPNCIYLKNGDECSNPVVKQRTFGWGLTICEEVVKQASTCNLRKAHEKPAPPPPPPKVGTDVKKLQIEISGPIGAGRSAIAGIVMNALKDTIPNCKVTFVEDSHPRGAAEIKELRERVAKVSPDDWFEYDVAVKTREIPEM